MKSAKEEKTTYDKIEVYRSTTSKVPAPETLGSSNTRLIIYMSSQYFSVAIQAYVDALDVLNRVIHWQSSPSSSTNDCPAAKAGTYLSKCKIAPDKYEDTRPSLVLSYQARTGLPSTTWPHWRMPNRQYSLADGQVFRFSLTEIELFPINALDSAC